MGYGYDPVGNRLSRTSSVAGVPSQTSTYDANDRLTSDTYDANGNTKTSTGGSYDYDFENRLTTHTSPVTSGFVYDGDGNRVEKTVGGVTINYLVDSNNHTGHAQVAEELQGGAVVKQFTYGHDLISQRIVGSTLSFYGYDGHGSVRQLTNASAAVTDAYDYDAFGNLIYRSGSTPNDYLYSGEQLDANLGFYYLRARYMNPSSGRFWTMDSFEGSHSDPVTLHKYLYTGNNPVDRLDPSGHDFNLQTLAVVTVVITVVAAIAILPAVYNSHFRGRSSGNEPPIEVVDQPFIVEGTGWDYSVAVTAHSAAIDFWKREANIIIKPLPLIMLPACDGSGNCAISQPITNGNGFPQTVQPWLQAKGVNPKHATFFLNSIIPPRGEIGGYTPVNSGFILVGPLAQGWGAAFGALSWAPAGATVAHEWGHTFIGPGHTQGGIMTEYVSSPYSFGRYLSDDQRIKARQGAMQYR